MMVPQVLSINFSDLIVKSIKYGTAFQVHIGPIPTVVQKMLLRVQNGYKRNLAIGKNFKKAFYYIVIHLVILSEV